MAKQKEAAVVGPVNVLPDQQQRLRGGGAFDEVAQHVQQEGALLFRRELNGVRDVVEALAKLREELSCHRGSLPKGLSQRRWWDDAESRLQHLHEWPVGVGACLVVTVPT